jgi:hypothetical protein
MLGPVCAAIPTPTAPHLRPAALPPAAERWLAHAVQPGSERLQRAEIRMHGEILVGRWRPFQARQVLDPGVGFSWAATAGRGPLAIRGWDRYVDGEGAMRWTVLGVPVMRAGGPDVTRSAAGRLAGETILSPAAALGQRVTWTPGPDDDHATFRIGVGAWDHDVAIAVDGHGGLASLDMLRWGDPHGDGYALHGFHARCRGGVTHMGITVPGEMHAGWRDADGTVREFVRATIDGATFR